MDKETILDTVKKAIDQSMAGMEIENSKFDFKLEWYKLDRDQGKNEFVKDLTAIANTFGPHGFLVIGYNDKTKGFKSSPFSNSGLSDTSMLPGIVNKKVDRICDFDLHQMEYKGNLISIFHVPPSIDKPHVIRLHQNYKDGSITKETQNAIFVRKSTGTVIAGKTDIELMFYDRKNLVPEYRIFSSFPYQSLNLIFTETMLDYNVFKASIALNLENAGSRPVAIIRFVIQLNIKTDPMVDKGEIELLTGDQYLLYPILLQPGQIISQVIAFQSDGVSNFKFDEAYAQNARINASKELLCSSGLELVLSNGQHIASDLTITK